MQNRRIAGHGRERKMRLWLDHNNVPVHPARTPEGPLFSGTRDLIPSCRLHFLEGETDIGQGVQTDCLQALNQIRHESLTDGVAGLGRTAGGIDCEVKRLRQPDQQSRSGHRGRLDCAHSSIDSKPVRLKRMPASARQSIRFAGAGHKVGLARARL